MTRFQKLVATTVATTFVLVVIGVVVRATDSGVACPSWPGCFPGQFLPGLDAGPNVWFEWIHRTVAFLIGILVVAVPVLASSTIATARRSCGRASPPSRSRCSRHTSARRRSALATRGPSVTAHLATAMILFAVLIYALAGSFYPARIAGRGSSQRFTLLAVFGTLATYGLLLFGSNVTAGG